MAEFDLKGVLDNLGHGILIFNKEGRLTSENLAARTLLGTDINLIRTNGWQAVSALFNTRLTNPDEMIEAVRDRALVSDRPVRFHVYLGGEYTPCWASPIQADNGDVSLMLTLDVVDWSSLESLMSKFNDEMTDAIQSTQGHIDLIEKTLEINKTEETEDLARRITGFTRLISVHMHRVGRLMEMLKRLEDIRTGKVRDIVRERRRKIDVENYLEDFVEALDEIDLVDPETEAQDHRSRITVEVSSGLMVNAPNQYLSRILQDILRNAIMYSMKATPIKIKVSAKNNSVQFDIRDEGYGIREKEFERVFEAFQRARQPQIIAEFGYGLSLYLCKHEVEAMNGRMWFESEPNVETTFSFMLPAWQEGSSQASSSDSETANP